LETESFLSSEAVDKIDLAVQQLNLNLNLMQDDNMTQSNFDRSCNSSVLSQRRQQNYMVKQTKTVETLSAIIDMLQSLKEKKLLDVKNKL